MSEASRKESNPKDVFGARKVPFSLLSGRVLAYMAVGMGEGGMKYGGFNWRHAHVLSSVYYDATLRHLLAWHEGQDIDPDSGLHHVVKAMTSLHVLMDAILIGKWIDDRPIRGGDLDFMSVCNGLVGTLLMKYPNPVARYTHIPLPPR